MKKTIETTEDFDCVAFKRKAQEGIYRAIKEMTPAQEIEYLAKRESEGTLGDWWRRVKATSSKAKSPKRARRSA